MAKRKTKKKKTSKKRRTRVAKKRSARKRTTKKRRGRRGRPSTKNLSSASMAQLQAEIERREGELSQLQDRRAQLLAELASVEDEIRRSGGAVGGGRRRGRRGPGRPPGTTGRRGRRGRRPRNTANLVESLQKVLDGKTMSVTEVTDAVQQAGYKTSSANFRTIVNQALINNPSVFKKVSRGQYTAK